uniref:Galaxin-like n=1 Tax=Syphacia muris TaxID=451379 RepID=A0A0N5AAA2_9BILA
MVSRQCAITVCCGDQSVCQNYTKADDLIGVVCCGNIPMNHYDQLCCKNVINERVQNFLVMNDCCGDQAISEDQTCCQETIHNIPNADCCGQEAYLRSGGKKICCKGHLLAKTSPNDVCCGDQVYDGGIMQLCCGDRVYPKSLYDSCCRASDVHMPYASATHYCCDSPVAKNGGRGCCYLRPNGSSIVAASYDTSKQCCTFPYLEIKPMINGTCFY